MKRISRRTDLETALSPLTAIVFFFEERSLYALGSIHSTKTNESKHIVQLK